MLDRHIETLRSILTPAFAAGVGSPGKHRNRAENRAVHFTEAERDYLLGVLSLRADPFDPLWVSINAKLSLCPLIAIPITQVAYAKFSHVGWHYATKTMVTRARKPPHNWVAYFDVDYDEVHVRYLESLNHNKFDSLIKGKSSLNLTRISPALETTLLDPHTSPIGIGKLTHRRTTALKAHYAAKDHAKEKDYV